MREESRTTWPCVGQSAVTIPAHASILKKEVQELLNYSKSTDGEGDIITTEAIPNDVFRNLSDSILALLDKVLDQPSLKDLAEAIKRVSQNTETILTNMQASKQVQSGRSSTVAAVPVQAVPDAVLVQEESLGLPPMSLQMVERLKTMPPETVEKIMEARRRSAAASQARVQAAGSAEAPKAAPFNVTARSVGLKATASAEAGGGTSKLVLESQSTEQGKVHDKIYSPLNKANREIRLVKLFPDPDPDYDIRCEVSIVSLDTRPFYKALSYTWGNPNDTVPITLNGRRFVVTRNLKKALQRLRDLDTETPIWVDAICINQADAAERMHQVELMRVIFENPNEVVVWLGDAQQMPGDELWDASCFNWRGDESDVPSINSIMAFAEALGDTYPEKSDPRSANPLMLGFCLMRLLAGDVHLADIPLVRNINLRAQCINAFSSLVAQPWWNRIWVVQEVILPSSVTVVFGRFTAPLRMYTDASSSLERHMASCCVGVIPTEDHASLPIENFCRKTLTIVESGNLWRKKESITLLTLLRLYYTKEATDARDKVYGLLGLVTDWGNSAAIAPSYTITTSELYQEVALRSIETSSSLAILTFRTERSYHKMMKDLRKIKENVTYHMYQKTLPPTAHPSEKRVQDELRKKYKSAPEPVELDLPSWTPDWETINQRGFEIQTFERINLGFIFDACAGRPAPPSTVRYTFSSVLTKTRVLTVAALRVGTVEQGDHQQWMPFFVNRNQILKVDGFPLPSNPNDLLDQPYVAGGNEYDALWHTVCADSFFVGSSSSAGLDGRAMFRRSTPDDKAAVQAWRRWVGRQKATGFHQPPNIKDFSSPEEHAIVVEADRAIRSAGLQRRYFKTDTGYMGLGSGAQGGDEVFVLLGSRMPYVLRPLGDIGVEELGETRLYTIVGDAYVHGIMDGELAKRPEVGAQELFVI